MRRAFPIFLLLVIGIYARCSAADKSPWVERPVIESGLRGTLFVHDGAPRPAVLVLGGAEGGLEGMRPMADHLANLGYNVLTLAYFGLPGMRPQLVRVPLEDFSRALDWLHKQPFVGACPVGILGCSKGAEAALLVACMRDDLAVVVVYVPSQVVWECVDEAHGSVASSWTRDGVDLPFIPYKRLAPAEDSGRVWDDRAKADVQPWQRPPDDVDSNWGWDCLRDLHVASLAVAPHETIEQAVIPVEKIQAPLLLFSGGRDLIWPSLTYANAIEARLKRLKSKIHFKNVSYPNAGHSFIYGSSDNGGTEQANRAAQYDSNRVLEMFLALHLPIAAPK